MIDENDEFVEWDGDSLSISKIEADDLFYRRRLELACDSEKLLPP